MVAISTERQLASIAGALIGNADLNDTERALVANGDVSDRATVLATRDLIAACHDPLGEAFLAIRSPETRRGAGAVYTPSAIVDAMIGWAAARNTPVRVVDPGAGSGRFIAAAARAFPHARLVACDIDPLATLILRANAAVLGFADRLDVHVTDYRLLDISRVSGPTLYIGNPPYVRHHGISGDAKTWFAATAAALGFAGSKLAGLHVHFFLRTREIASAGDYGAFVTSAEWMDVNYGSVLRQMLADGLGGSSLQLFSPRGMPFADAMTTGAITTFIVGERPAEFTVREVSSVDELDDLDAGRRVSWADVKKQTRWSRIMREPIQQPSGSIPLGEIFRVHRGLVTGNNSVFIAGNYPGFLPSDYLVSAVTRAKDLIDAGERITAETAKCLRKLILLPAGCEDATARRAIEEFKRWAAARSADQSWTAKQRAHWWSIRAREPAPILCTYMGRRPPVFVLNEAGVPHINIAHGLYPRKPMPPAVLAAYARYLSKNVCVTEGRTYAGGLTKFEPKEIERIMVPCLDRIHDHADSLDDPAIRGRRRAGEKHLSQGTAGRDAGIL